MVLLTTHTLLLFYIGIYQPETFKRESKYGLTVLTTTDQGLLTYLGAVTSQMGSWLAGGDVQRLVVVVTGIDSGETLERWQFNVCVDDGCDGNNFSATAGNDENISSNLANRKDAGSDSKNSKSSKTVKEVHDEIQAIIRQITASVSRANEGAMSWRLISIFSFRNVSSAALSGYFSTSLK